jgi:hypothetical protein
MTACKSKGQQTWAAGGRHAALNSLTREDRRVMGLRAHSDTRGSDGRVVVGRVVVMERRVWRCWERAGGRPLDDGSRGCGPLSVLHHDWLEPGPR